MSRYLASATSNHTAIIPSHSGHPAIAYRFATYNMITAQSSQNSKHGRSTTTEFRTAKTQSFIQVDSSSYQTKFMDGMAPHHLVPIAFLYHRHQPSVQRMEHRPFSVLAVPQNLKPLKHNRQWSKVWLQSNLLILTLDE